MSGAPEGNENALRFKTPEERRQICEDYCTHIRQGFSDESFNQCRPATLGVYRKKYPIEFDAEKIEQARAERYRYWEALGIAGAMGKIPGFNAAAWIFNMKNRFGWRDKTEFTTGDGGQVPLVTFVLPQKDDVAIDAGLTKSLGLDADPAQDGNGGNVDISGMVPVIVGGAGGAK
jgi:hypothetical protein